MIIFGKNINLRTVQITDAQFIFDLRNNKTKTKHLSQVSGEMQDQEKWIVEYKKREKREREFYFIIESKNNEKLGLVRVYDFKNIHLSGRASQSFCWGSWLIKPGAPKTTAIESAIQVYEFAFYKLGFENCHFDVRKGNDKVIAFHTRFGAEIVSEDELQYYFNFSRENYESKSRLKYKRYLQNDSIFRLKSDKCSISSGDD